MSSKGKRGGKGKSSRKEKGSSRKRKRSERKKGMDDPSLGRSNRRFGFLRRRRRGIPIWFLVFFAILLLLVLIAFLFGDPV